MKEAAIKIGGKDYLLTALDASAVKDLHDEFKATAACPVKELMAIANELPDTMRDGYIKENINNAVARKRARESLDSVEFKRWMECNPIDAAARIYHAMFRKHHPNLTREECVNLAMQASEEGGEAVFDGLFPRIVARSEKG
jgi:hypothetical protein